MKWQQRLDRAVEAARHMPQYAWLLRRAVSGGRADLYTVRSSTHKGVWYLQHVYERGISCTCPAGQRGFPCKHAARLALRLCREYRMPALLDFPESPYELFDGDDDFATEEVREPDLGSLLWMAGALVVCEMCHAENEPGAVRCAVCSSDGNAVYAEDTYDFDWSAS